MTGFRLQYDELNREFERKRNAAFGWTETSDEGVSDGCGFSIVPGRSTREIRTFDARGDAVRVERLAWPLGGEPPVLLSWETHVYDAGHRVVSSAYSDGTSDAAAWICTGPVWTRDRSGVVVSNTYNAGFWGPQKDC